MNALYVPLMTKMYQEMVLEMMLYPFTWWMYLPRVKQETQRKVEDDYL